MKKVTVDGKTYKFPDDATPEEMEGIISGAAQTAPEAPQSEGAVDPLAYGRIPIPGGYMSTGKALDALPALGGMVGGLGAGLLGIPSGPGAFAAGVGGAMAGGAAGETAREALRGQKLNPGKIAFEGGKEGALQVVGGAAAGLAGKAARPIMRRAMGLGGTDKAGKVVVRGSRFPDPVETALFKGLEVSKEGSKKATDLALEANRELDKILATAKLQGRNFKTADITKYARKVARSRGLEPEAREALAKRVLSFLKDKGKTVDPELLRDIKQEWQAAADFKATTAAEVPSKRLGKAMYKGAREQLGTIKGATAADAKLQKLMGAERAIDAAITKKPAPFDFHRPSSWPGVNLLKSSGPESRLAIALADPEFQAVLRQSPRTAAALIQQMLLSAESDATAMGQ